MKEEKESITLLDIEERLQNDPDEQNKKAIIDQLQDAEKDLKARLSKDLVPSEYAALAALRQAVERAQEVVKIYWLAQNAKTQR